MSFYPVGYDQEIKERREKQKEKENIVSDYMKVTEGDHRIRILMRPIIGYESWDDGLDKEGKPTNVVTRKRTFQEMVNIPSRDGKIKEFHAFIVWDYQKSMVRLLNVTQMYKDDIYDSTIDPDWGDPTKYDIIIKRVGTGFNDTKYTIRPVPHKPLSEEIKKAFSLIKIDEEQYFTGGHPIIREQAENDGKEVLRKTAEALGAKPITEEDVKRMSSEALAEEVPF